MPNGWLEKNGVDRRVKYGVLRNLEAAELIKADWRRERTRSSPG